MSSEVKKFCNDIGTPLRALEEGAPWINQGISKERDVRIEFSIVFLGLLC